MATDGSSSRSKRGSRAGCDMDVATLTGFLREAEEGHGVSGQATAFFP
jgi:hypothetical protein